MKLTTLNQSLELLRVLSDVTRQQIVLLFLDQKEYTATEIVKYFPKLSQPNISHHLQIMKRGNVIIARKLGKEIYYSFNKKNVTSILECLLEEFRKCKVYAE